MLMSAWPLPEANSTTVCDLTVPSVRSLPLSVMVCSQRSIGIVRAFSLSITCVNFVSIHLIGMRSVVPDIDVHTCLAMQSH